MTSWLMLRLGGALEFGDIELFHLQHGLHGLGMAEQFGYFRGDDLPGQSELVFDPAALAAGRIRGELGPIIVNLLLGIAPHDEGDGFGEFENGATVQGRELLAVEFEGDGENGAFRDGTVSGSAKLFEAAGIFEHRDVEIHGLVGVGIEPQKRCDARIVF